MIFQVLLIQTVMMILIEFRLWAEQIEDYGEVSKEVVTINKDKSISNKDIQKYRLWKTKKKY